MIVYMEVTQKQDALHDGFMTSLLITSQTINVLATVSISKTVWFLEKHATWVLWKFVAGVNF